MSKRRQQQQDPSCGTDAEVDVSKRLGLTIAVLFVATSGLAQDRLILSGKVSPQVRLEARTLYAAVCTTAEREFGATRPLRPKVVLVLSADHDVVDWERSRITLRKWDPYLFAQGVIAFAYRQLMPLHVGLRANGTIKKQDPRSMKE